MTKINIIIGFFAFLAIWTVRCSKLNVPKVLLPYQTGTTSSPVKFLLQISDSNDGITGCFQWKSSNSEVVTVHPLFDDNRHQTCASKAIVSAVSRQSKSRMAIVFAEDMSLGVTLRCDVMVDSIHSLEILTTTKKLYLEDSPELFIVRAKNEGGDTFANLDGIVFDWKIETPDGQTAPGRIVPFSDSEYESTEAIRRLESERLRGDRVLVEGVSSGVAIITVRINNDAYQSSVQPHSIRLTVMAQLILEPSADIWVLVGSRIQYSLKLMRYKKAELISLSSSQYRIAVEAVEPKSGLEIARFDKKTSILEALAEGIVQLVVEDKKLDSAIAAQDLPSAFVYVVEPVSIRFLVSSGSWVFEIGRSYEVTVGLLDVHGRALFMAGNTVLHVTFPSGLLKATQSSAGNGTVWIVEALKEGSSSITAKYDSYLDMHGHPKVRPTVDGEQPFEVYHSMSITPSLLVFPPCHKTASASDFCYEHRLIVHGGSGQFVWLVDPVNTTMSSAKISVHGIEGRHAIVSTSKGGPGAAVAKAADVKHRLHKASTRIVVTDPVDAQFVDGPREVELGSVLRLGLRLNGKIRMSEERLVPFTDCHRLPFEVQVTNEAVLKFGQVDSVQRQSTDGDACATFSFIGQSIGDTMVSVKAYSDGSATFTANVAISVYAPLKVVSPADSQVILTPTSSYPIVFTGGPTPFPADPQSHIMAAERLGKSGIDYFETSRITELDGVVEKKNSVTVSCLSGTPSPTEASLLISVGNNKTASNKFPALSTAKVKIVCEFPLSMVLRLKRKRPVNADLEFPPCPLEISGSNSIPVYVKSKFDILADIFDKEGRKFQNASALLFTWRVSDSALLRAPGTKAHSLHSRASDKFGHEYYETFQPLGVEGEVKVTAEVVGVVPDACSKQEKKPCEEFLHRSLKTSGLIRLVQYAVLSPSTVVLYNHPKTSVFLTINGGSGQFFIPKSTTENAVSSFRLVDDGGKVEAKPSGIGSGEVILSVYDSCLVESAPAQATIVVSSIDKLVLVGPSLIMLGNRLTLRVQAVDKLNRQLATEDIFGFLPLEVRVEGTGLSRRSNRESTAATLSFDATELGTVSVFISATDPTTGNTVRGAAHRVQVFPSLEIEPKSISLIAGARFQLRITGGLQYSPSSWFIDPVSSGVTFLANDSKVIIIGQDGLIEAKRPGSVSVVARLANPEKSDEFLAEDTVTVRVVQLASAKIHAPTTTVYAGSTIPLAFIGHGHRDHPTNIDSNDMDLVLPWGVGGADIPVKLSWIVDGDGAEIDSPNIDQTASSVHLHCTKSGVVQIRLSIEQPHVEMAKLQFAHQRFRAILNASLTITVMDEVRYSGPDGWLHDGTLPPHILMTHGAKTSLKLTGPLHHLRYRINGQTQLINIDDNGNVQSTSNQDIADSVSVDMSGMRADVSDHSVLASVIISVLPVSYLMASPDQQSIWREKSLNDAFPVSYVLKFPISYHDRSGLRFDAIRQPTSIHFRPNRFDLVDISVVRNGIVDYLQVHLKSAGETIIKVWNSDYPTSVSEYLRFVAVQAITPSSAIAQIGQRFSFSNSLSSQENDFSWTSSDPSVLAVDPSTGFAVAKSPGQSIISHNLHGDGDKLVTSTVINVAEPTSISIEKVKGPKALIDVDDGTETIFSVKFHGSTGELESLAAPMDLIDSKISMDSFPFTCELQVSPPLSSPDNRVFRFESAYISSIGFVCVLKKVSRLPSSPSTGSDATRNVSVWAKRRGLVTESITYAVYPPITLQPSTEIFIDNERMSRAVIRILATQTRLDRVKMALSTDAQLLLKLSPKKGQPNADVSPRKEYVVKLRSDAFAVLDQKRHLDLHVEVIDETTDSVQRIPIRLKFFAKAPVIAEDRDFDGLIGLLWHFLIWIMNAYGTMFLLIASAIMAIICINYVYKFFAKPGTHGIVAPTNSSRVSPAHIPWRSYGAQGLKSPQSPKLWSVDTSQRTP